MEVTALTAPLSVTADPQSAVTVRFSAGTAEIAGTRLARIPVWDGATIRDVFSAVERIYPGLRRLEGRLLFAANAEYSGYERVLHAGDQLCLISPVSGGAYL